MPSFRDGQVNLLALQNPGAYINVIPPTPFLVGVPTNIEAMVGVASWGPVNSVMLGTTVDDAVNRLGLPLNRPFDICKHVVAATQAGAAVNFRWVRVTDGTDTAASIAITTGTGPTVAAGTFTARYTGIRGNDITVSIQATAKANAFAAIVNFPGRAPERFDNIPHSAGSPFWVNLAAAINNGTEQRARSSAVIFTAGVSTAAPTVGTTYKLTGGTDGAAGVNTATLVGQDALPRTGMYALRGLRKDNYGTPDTFALCDCTDTSVWAVMLSFALSEGMFAVVATASGTSIADTIAARVSQGIDDTAIKIIAGDWPTVYIPGIGSTLVSPTAVYQGLCGNLSPEQSPINKPLIGVTATLTSQTGVLTSDAEESVAQTGGIDFIGRSAALGQDFFSFLTGRNASSNTAANGDEYTRLTNFLVRSLEGAATRSIVGRLQSTRADDPTRIKAKAILDSFFGDLKRPEAGSDGYGVIEDAAVQCNELNNTPTTIAKGFLFAFCAVKYLNVVRYFVIKLQGGGNVSVTVQNTQPTLTTVVQLANAA